MNMYIWFMGIAILGNLDILQCGAPNEHNSSNDWVYACFWICTYNELVTYLVPAVTTTRGQLPQRFQLLPRQKWMLPRRTSISKGDPFVSTKGYLCWLCFSFPAGSGQAKRCPTVCLQLLSGQTKSCPTFSNAQKTWHFHVNLASRCLFSRPVGHGRPSPWLLRDGRLPNGRP